MMASLPPASVMNVLQSGFPVDIVFRLVVQSMNGIDNRRVAGGIARTHVRPADPEFYVLLEQLGHIQSAGDMGVRVGLKGDTLNLVFRRSNSATVKQAVRKVTDILNLDPEAKEYPLFLALYPSTTRKSRCSLDPSSRSCSTSRRPSLSPRRTSPSGGSGQPSSTNAKG